MINLFKEQLSLHRIILFLLPIVWPISTTAQFSPAKIPAKLRDVSVISPKYLHRGVLPGNSVNPTVNSKSVLEDIVGTSRYDNQTDGSMPARTHLWPDGTISVSWMQGFLNGSGYADRGTGYNYFNGSAWQATPATRIENNVRTGWPGLKPWMGKYTMLSIISTISGMKMITKSSSVMR